MIPASIRYESSTPRDQWTKTRHMPASRHPLPPCHIDVTYHNRHSQSKKQPLVHKISGILQAKCARSPTYRQMILEESLLLLPPGWGSQPVFSTVSWKWLPDPLLFRAVGSISWFLLWNVLSFSWKNGSFCMQAAISMFFLLLWFWQSGGISAGESRGFLLE